MEMVNKIQFLDEALCVRVMWKPNFSGVFIYLPWYFTDLKASHDNVLEKKFLISKEIGYLV